MLGRYNQLSDGRVHPLSYASLTKISSTTQKSQQMTSFALSIFMEQQHHFSKEKWFALHQGQSKSHPNPFQRPSFNNTLPYNYISIFSLSTTSLSYTPKAPKSTSSQHMATSTGAWQASKRFQTPSSPYMKPVASPLQIFTATTNLMLKAYMSSYYQPHYTYTAEKNMQLTQKGPIELSKNDAAPYAILFHTANTQNSWSLCSQTSYYTG